ncbi:MAG: 50S ribosomal protein L10 [Deltaproteobacteria bacterium GWA2_47_9]|nr:MAG: 50S ribosomal protein L10 [Deltaproteobacteria bacterium GWA2_47_9]
MEKKKKEDEVSELREKFSRANAAILGDYRGLTVSQIDKLRNALRNVSGELRVAKNTLARIASKGTGIEKIESHLKGPTAIILSYSDQAAVAKALTAFAKEQDKFKIRVGVLGNTVLDVKGIKALAELPGLDQLRANILGLIQAPASKLARLMATPGSQVARVVKAHSEK